MLERSWVEINLEQLKQNYFAYKNTIRKDQEIIAVVKANAYGHGDIEVAKILEDIGVNHFAVSNIDEGIKLRKKGIKGTILVLSYTPQRDLYKLCKFDIMQTVLSPKYAEDICMSKLPIKVQIAIDTGMNRLGFNGKNTEACANQIKEYSKRLHVVGFFTHLSSADNDEHIEFTLRQIERFKNIANACKSLNLEFVHCLNSLGGIKYNNGDFRFVRLGILLYGLLQNKNYKPILKWKSVVSMIKTVEKDEFIGYGLSYKTKRKSLIATIPTGYADGFNRRLSNKGVVVINSLKAQIVGRICMDQFMVDVTDLPSVKQGDEVELLGDLYSAEDMAKDLDTISYEVVCAISTRVKKIYINK